jgi:hypothetical protein
MTGEIVLVADDDETAREILIGLAILDQASCVVTDVRMPGRDGAKLVSELTRGNRHVPAGLSRGIRASCAHGRVIQCKLAQRQNRPKHFWHHSYEVTTSASSASAPCPCG